MADGDEKIDYNDRVLVLNRMSDAPTEVQHNGVMVVWKPGEVRSIQRDDAYGHFIRHSRVKEDPTGTNPGVYKLVIVNEAREPLDASDAVTPLTAAYVKELEKYGFLDTTHLSPDRQFGGDSSMQLIDPESGQHPAKTELRGAPRDPSDFRPFTPAKAASPNL